MNIHHLELFYYVARHGGISEAVRNIPYGIQQPAVSYQILQLEDHLGVTLFQRRPFALTREGEKLYRFIEPFFSGLEAVADELQGGSSQQIRFGASEVVLKDHLPEILPRVRKQFPHLRFSLRDGYHPQLMDWLQADEIDMAVTVLDQKLPVGINSITLMKLPLKLMVEKKSKITSAEDLWKLDKIEERLITLPATEVVSKNFQTHLTTLGVDWFPTIEVGTLELIETYVSTGYGIGVGVAIPKPKPNPLVRALPLPGFPPVVVAVLWQGRTTPVIQAFLDEINHHVAQLAPPPGSPATNS